jgi:phosphohistidine phosphatase
MTEAKHLFVLRHAKSSWDDPALDDHDRPLSARGRRAASLIGAYLDRQQVEVTLVLCSSARRTRETLQLISAPGEIRIERELYDVSAHQLLARLHRVGDDVAGVMLIGHNPAIHDLAVSLAASAGELTAGKFPTGGLATLTFGGPWHALEAGQADLAAFVTPRQLG